MPQEFTLFPGKSQTFKARGIDANGFPLGPVTDEKWESFIPPHREGAGHAGRVLQ